MLLPFPTNAIGTVCNYYGGSEESVTEGNAIFRRIKRGKENMTVHDLHYSPLGHPGVATPRHATPATSREDKLSPPPRIHPCYTPSPSLPAIGYPLSFIRLRKAPAAPPPPSPSLPRSLSANFGEQ